MIAIVTAWLAPQLNLGVNLTNVKNLADPIYLSMNRIRCHWAIPFIAFSSSGRSTEGWRRSSEAVVVVINSQLGWSVVLLLRASWSKSNCFLCLRLLPQGAILMLMSTILSARPRHSLVDWPGPFNFTAQTSAVMCFSKRKHYVDTISGAFYDVLRGPLAYEEESAQEHSVGT